MKNPAKKLLLALLGMSAALTLSAQTTITGVVTDESGEELYESIDDDEQLQDVYEKFMVLLFDDEDEE